MKNIQNAKCSLITMSTQNTNTIYLTESLYRSGLEQNENNYKYTPLLRLVTVLENMINGFLNKIESFSDKSDIKREFDKIPELKLNCSLKTDEPCSICLENYRTSQCIKILPCTHYYHKHCIKEWLCKKEKSCPMCRQSI